MSYKILHEFEINLDSQEWKINVNHSFPLPSKALSCIPESLNEV